MESCCEEEGAAGRGNSSGEDESDGEKYWMTEGEGMGKEERAGYWQIPKRDFGSRMTHREPPS